MPQFANQEEASAYKVEHFKWSARSARLGGNTKGYQKDREPLTADYMRSPNKIIFKEQ